MNIEILARTIENNNGDYSEHADFGHDAYILGGRAAGVCYGPENYFDAGIHKETAAVKRADRTSKSGHHSVFEHSYITLMISGLSKMAAMTLNSTGAYVTSEKSARYTKMEPKTELEKQMYDKWYTIFSKLIAEEYPDKNLDISKLAMENARYTTDVFTPTNMIYTLSYRQMCYIISWIDEYKDLAEKSSTKLYKKLWVELDELKNKFVDILGGDEYVIKPNKQTEFKFFRTLRGIEANSVRQSIGDTYTIEYKCSFACLAQLQRHRTLHYEMAYKDDYCSGYYIPEIIPNEVGLRKQWVDDMIELRKAGVYPQATLVFVKEQGSIDDFIQKANERMCARAQLEIMRNTENTFYQLKYYKNNMSNDIQDEFDQWFKEDGQTLKLKCQVKKCLEPCVWGATGRSRNI